MNTIHIRPMLSNDIPAAVESMIATPLWQRYGVSAENARAQFEGGLARHDVLLVADLDTQRVAGFAWCILGGAFGRSTYLRLLGVHPDMTGTGVGALLLDAAESLAAKAGDDLILLVSDFNEGAQRFYRRQGYEQIGAIPGYVLPDVTELIFRKRLAR